MKNASFDLLTSEETPLNERIERVRSLDLGPIKFKLVHAVGSHSHSIEDAERIESQYKNFLILNLMHPQMQIVPNQEVDAFWHAHILDTSKYACDCEQVFGRYLHHFPYFGLRGEDDAQRLQEAFRQSKHLYEATFGKSYSGDNAECQVSACDAEQCSPNVEGIKQARPSWDAFVNDARLTHA